MRERPVGTALLLACCASAQSTADIRNALDKSLPVLERSAASFVSQRTCVSCHHNILPILLLHDAQQRGVPVDSATFRSVEDKTFRSLRNPTALDDAIQATTLNDPTPNDSMLLMAAGAAGLQPDLTTAVLAQRLLFWQRGGHWVTSDFRPPHSSSYFTTTSTAIRAIQFYAPPELNTARGRALRDARQWLIATRPVSTEDASFRLLGLVWAGASKDQLAAARRDLLGMQRPNGGWSQTENYSPDAYSTGEAIYALTASSVSAGDKAVQRGLKFVISTQAPDGTWRVHTRMLSPADVSPKYFTTGFPYEKDEYISYAATAWTAMALVSALARNPGGIEGSGLFAPAASQPDWVRTALFGTADQLRALLDNGLDPNSQTSGGSTLLMMAAANADKVRLLISRGADVNARAPSGADALTIASAYRGTADSVNALLDAGASPKAPEGKRVRTSPLVFASMAGDLDNVKLLLAHGADPNTSAGGNTPLAQSITFGYPDVAQALIDAGASAGIRDSNGVNLLHWASITGRSALIPILARAHVPINTTDDFGYTPLMYAATIDFGGTDLVKALLKNGADKTIANDDGLTPEQQAHKLRLAHIEAAIAK